MNAVKWLDKNFELVILAVLLIIMSVLSFWNVVMRFVFNNPIGWSDEICCYCLALSAFFSLPCAVRMGTTIRVDTLTMVLSAKIQRIITLICSVLMIVFLSLLIIGGIDLVKSAAEIGQASPALGIPVANMYRLMVIGFGLTIFRYAELIVRVLTGRDLETEGENK